MTGRTFDAATFIIARRRPGPYRACERKLAAWGVPKRISSLLPMDEYALSLCISH